MSTLHITFSATALHFAVDDQATRVPVGTATLAADLRHDPPSPEELTNAIGLVLDHMEDVEREAPGVAFADRIELAGDGVHTIAAVEVGGEPTLPFALSREAAEDVFRTLVTEADAARSHNPGLPAAMVRPVLGVACALVAVLRFLRVDEVWVVEP